VSMTWEELEEQCRQCTGCLLAGTRHNVVFGSGNKNAKIMFVGEGPGETEDLEGLPFVGRAGKLLDTYLESVGMKRQDVYIANMVKCRPPGNRDPQPEEQQRCWSWLAGQIELINPKLIVCLGRISAGRLIRPDFRVTVEHGKIYDIDGRKVMGTFHPATLLRTAKYKIPCFEDFKVIARMAGTY